MAVALLLRGGHRPFFTARPVAFKDRPYVIPLADPFERLVHPFPKLLRILSLLDVAQGPDDLAIPSFRTHQLKGDLAGHWSIWVNGNWRITFRFVDGDVELVDYQDYH